MKPQKRKQYPRTPAQNIARQYRETVEHRKLIVRHQVQSASVCEVFGAIREARMTDCWV